MSRNNPLKVEGHGGVYPATGPHTGNLANLAEDGMTELPSQNGPGRCRCRCGLVSPVLSSSGRRWAWHRRHREEVAGVPWSDAAMAAELEVTES